jgi:hypothetical protein
LASI